MRLIATPAPWETVQAAVDRLRAAGFPTIGLTDQVAGWIGVGDFGRIDSKSERRVLALIQFLCESGVCCVVPRFSDGLESEVRALARIERIQTRELGASLEPLLPLRSRSRVSAEIASRPFVLLFSGLKGSGKTSLGVHLRELLVDNGIAAQAMDSGKFWHTIGRDLHRSARDGTVPESVARDRNHVRVAKLAAALASQGVLVAVSFCAKRLRGREQIRRILASIAVDLRVVQTTCDETERLRRVRVRAERKGLTSVESAARAAEAALEVYESGGEWLTCDTTFLSARDAARGIAIKLADDAAVRPQHAVSGEFRDQSSSVQVTPALRADFDRVLMSTIGWCPGPEWEVPAEFLERWRHGDVGGAPGQPDSVG